MSKCKVCGGHRNVAIDGPDPIGVPGGHPSLVACPKCQRARHERYLSRQFSVAAAAFERDVKQLNDSVLDGSLFGL